MRRKELSPSPQGVEHTVLPQAFPDHSPFQTTHVPGKKNPTKQNQEPELTHCLLSSNAISTPIPSLVSYI